MDTTYQIFVRNGNIFEYAATTVCVLAVDAPNRLKAVEPGDEFIVTWTVAGRHRAAFVKYDLTGKLA